MNANVPPNIVVLAGPNGAGKSTTGPALLRDTLGITKFVDADTIARGLSAFEPERVALAAGKVMIRRIRGLARRREDFAFETTLASRLLAPWLAKLREAGYRVHIVFLWLPSADSAVDRVAGRVRMGGHDIPEETIRRRYRRGLRNFFELYQPLATTWRMYDNYCGAGPRVIAWGAGRRTTRLDDAETWARVLEGAGREEQEDDC